jgi:hypothetical protein
MSSYRRSVVVWTPSASKENQGQQEFVVAVEKVDTVYAALFAQYTLVE